MVLYSYLLCLYIYNSADSYLYSELIPPVFIVSAFLVFLFFLCHKSFIEEIPEQYRAIDIQNQNSLTTKKIYMPYLYRKGRTDMFFKRKEEMTCNAIIRSVCYHIIISNHM